MPTAGGFDVSGIYESASTDVYPENWAAVTLFSRLGTQWRSGFSGPTGLDYSVLFRLIDEAGLTGDEWQQMLDDIQVLEIAALGAMRAANGD